MTFYEKVEALRAALDAWGKEAPPTVDGEILLGGAASDLLALLDDLTPPDGDARPMVVWVGKPESAGGCNYDCPLRLHGCFNERCRLQFPINKYGGPEPGPGCPWYDEGTKQ